MADFRKSLLLAAMALAVGVGTASAQTTECIGNNGVPPLLRAEGVTELTGLISFNCPGVVAGGTANITVSVSAPITSQPTEPYLTVASTGVDGYPATYAGTVVGQAVVFNGVVLPTNLASGFTVGIGGVRVNASTVATSPTAGIFSQVNSVITINNVNVPLNPLFVVGYVVPGAAAASITPYSLGGASACSTSPTSLSLASTVYGSINVTESALDADVFKPQGPISTSFDSESGTNLSGNPAFPAQSGTQFAVGLTIPSGITVYLPVTITSTSGSATNVGTAVLVTGPGSTVAVTPTSGLVYSDTGGAAGNLLEVTGTGAAVTYYYNVVTSNASLVENYFIPVFASGAISSGLPSAQVALAPIAGPSTPTTVIPEFAGLISPSSPAYAPLFGTSAPQACQTTLLFPFMTNQAGFDTGFSIAATSTDPTGTENTVANANPGTCTLYFYGDLAPTTAPSVAASPGYIELHSTVSAVAPGFQGYMMAVCDFVYAHGYAFITDGFMGPGRGLSEGYVANVIPLGTRAGSPSTPVGTTGQPEILGH
ncbi:hypothetical protein [Nevskia soli]|jgi:hypothetical protein|uniref:hypothetical protein n=1 Tax=Nevskia soli TaxID=418856 RepID=UPI0015D89A8B|nr:hypothetical protein [Nevskia soli]